MLGILALLDSSSSTAYPMCAMSPTQCSLEIGSSGNSQQAPLSSVQFCSWCRVTSARGSGEWFRRLRSIEGLGCLIFQGTEELFTFLIVFRAGADQRAPPLSL